MLRHSVKENRRAHNALAAAEFDFIFAGRRIAAREPHRNLFDDGTLREDSAQKEAVSTVPARSGHCRK